MVRENSKRIICFVFLGLCFLMITQKIFVQKFNPPTNNDGITRGIQGAYLGPKDSLEVIYLGTSHMTYGISPMDMYAMYGITSYNNVI